MPNHVTNTLSLSIDSLDGNDRLKEILDEIKGEDGQDIDFAKIISEPDNLFRGNLGQEDKERCAREGIPNWYNWNIDNWGTKWNAYAIKVGTPEYGEVEIQFDTAWTAPFPVIAALREKYPDLHVGGSWLEEGHQSAGVF